MKKELTPQVTSDMLQRAALTQTDFDQINDQINFDLVDDLHAKQELEQAIVFKKYRQQLIELMQVNEGSYAPRGHTTPSAPTSNRGGKSKNPHQEVKALIKKHGFIEDIKGLVSINGEAKAVPANIPAKEHTSFIDYVHVTALDKDFYWDDHPVDDAGMIEQISLVINWIFGFHVTNKLPKGQNFYDTSYECTSTDGIKYCIVSFGGQRNTVLLSVPGEGCHAARSGWENRLYKFLNLATQGRITRIDLAYDDADGLEFNCDSMEQAYDQGQFNTGGRNPDIELRGNWKRPNGKGRTLYVGNRQNGKFFRCYEKGKQLGDPDSLWVRAEVELKSRDRFIPFDILLKPAEYMAAQYPVLNFISQEQSRIKTITKTVQTSYLRMTTWLKHQCGAAINFAYQVEGDAQKVIDMIIREGKTPRGLSVPDYKDKAEKLFQPSSNFSPVFGTF